jgi:5-(carboxyamino)imidazole ribonucleotide mutase
VDPVVGIVMGSSSDREVMAEAGAVLGQFSIPFETRVISAHRTPDVIMDYGREARARGLRVFIAGAGGAAHLPGVLAGLTTLPVIGVPIALARLDGLDSLLSIVQMPRGVPVATVAINGAANAGLLAVRILGVADARLADALTAYQREMAAKVLEQDRSLLDGPDA